MSNPFKNFTVFNLFPVGLDKYHATAFAEIAEYIDHYHDQVETINAQAQDPSGGQWSHTGLVHAAEDSYIHSLDGAGLLLAVQFNERILPAKVRDEKVTEAVAKLAEQQGHKVNKKDYAQIREQVEFDLLPQAFIRRSIVYVMITPEDQMFVFTASSKKADTAAFVVRGFFENEFELRMVPLQVVNPVLPYLKSVALDHGGDDDIFYPSSAMLLKGDEKETIRIKDRDVGGYDIQTLLKGDYSVHELGMHMITSEDIDPVLSFAMTDKLIFKRVEIPNTRMETDKDADGKVAFHSFAWMVAKEYRALVKAMTAELGGTPAVEPTTPEEDDGEI